MASARERFWLGEAIDALSDSAIERAHHLAIRTYGVKKHRRARITPQPIRTHDAIARELGISRSRVQQLEQSALKKLRRICAERGLSLQDLLGR